MRTGISLYPGLDRTAAENKALLVKAAELGIDRVFTSLHIPESNTVVLQEEMAGLLQTARHYDLDVIADISPAAARLLELPALTPKALLDLGITTARFDYGFDVRKIAFFSHFMGVQLNASTLRPSDLAALRAAGADFHRLDSLHNFYPRPHTGLGEDYVQRQNQWLQGEKIRTGLSIPSQSGRRAPFHAGLPTLEKHRTMTVEQAGRHAIALGTDSLFIGDDGPSLAELTALAANGREEKGCIVLRARLISHDPFIQDLLSTTLTSRLDPAADAIRAQESRILSKGQAIRPDETAGIAITCGDVTVDNDGYGRYKGEVQISLVDQDGDGRTNKAAVILEEDRFLLSYIRPGSKFRLVLSN